MNIDHTPESEQFDARLNHAIVDPAVPKRGIDNDELWKIRLTEYQAECLMKDDASEACLAAITGDLMEFAQRIKRPITTELDRDPTSLETVGKLGPALDSYCRIVRQIERYEQLRVRAAESRTRGADSLKKCKTPLAGHIQGPPKRKN